MRPERPPLGATVVAAFLAATCLTMHAHAAPIPLTLISNSVTNDTASSSLGGNAIIHDVEGDLVNGAYEGGGAAISTAQGMSGLINSFSAKAYAEMYWDVGFTVDSVNPVDLYCEWQLNLFSSHSALGLYAFADGGIEATLGVYRVMDIAFAPGVVVPLPLLIGPELKLKYSESTVTGDSLYMGRALPSEELWLVGEFKVASAVKIVSFGSASAADLGTLNFKLSANDPVPEPSPILLLGLGLIRLVGGRRRPRRRGSPD